MAFLNRVGFFLMNGKGDTLIKRPADYYSCKFKDLNHDGFKDIFLENTGNTPERFDLYLFVPATKIFKVVRYFDEFPSPTRIGATKYFYSYHKSGCADLDWDSDLFYISNFKSIKLGIISGRGCKDENGRGGIFIYRAGRKNRILVKKFSIQQIEKYKDLKWGFIKDYWKNNYRTFI